MAVSLILLVIFSSAFSESDFFRIGMYTLRGGRLPASTQNRTAHYSRTVDRAPILTDRSPKVYYRMPVDILKQDSTEDLSESSTPGGLSKVETLAGFFLATKDYRACTGDNLAYIVNATLADKNSSFKSPNRAQTDVQGFLLFCHDQPRVETTRTRVSSGQGGGLRVPDVLADSKISSNPKDMNAMKRILEDKKPQCNPKKMVVPLPLPTDDTTVRIYPACTIIERCGGCCDNELTTCVPQLKGIKQKKKPVILMRATTPGGPIQYEKITYISVERHTKCTCECKIQAHNCTSLQRYDENQCRCICQDESEKYRCTAPRYWDERSCRCRCPQVLECTTGLFFDSKSCSCLTAQEIQEIN